MAAMAVSYLRDVLLKMVRSSRDFFYIRPTGIRLAQLEMRTRKKLQKNHQRGSSQQYL